MTPYNITLDENGKVAVFKNGGDIPSLEILRVMLTGMSDFVSRLEPSYIEYENKLNLEMQQKAEKEKTKEQEKINKKGFVYLIKGEDGNRYKIGCSKNPKTRLNQLKTASKENHSLIYSFKSLDMYAMEKDLHEIFDPNRLHSEWFSLSYSDVLCIKGYEDEY